MNIAILFCVFIFAQAEDWSDVEETELIVDPRFLSVPLSTSMLISQKVYETDNRIVGGEEADPHQFPFQAGLLLTLPDGRRSFCGGSLISQRFILTAAHCVDGRQSVEVRLGAHHIFEKEDTQVRINSTKFIIHEKWDPQMIRNDIALIKLPQPVQLNENIIPIELPSKSDKRDFMGKEAIVSGWGRTSDKNSNTSAVLRAATTKIISNKQCFLTYPFIINPSHICMDGKEGKSSCNGDSGGPLFICNDTKPYLIGLVSFGRADGCERQYPAVYTRITSFIDWIEKHLI